MNATPLRVITPQEKPPSTRFAQTWPELYAPETVTAAVETLTLGLQQFRDELAAGPPDFPPEFAMPRTEAMDRGWISNITRRINEWEGLLAEYQQLQTQQEVEV